MSNPYTDTIKWYDGGKVNYLEVFEEYPKEIAAERANFLILFNIVFLGQFIQ